jgi:hypothetical protein
VGIVQTACFVCVLPADTLNHLFVPHLHQLLSADVAAWRNAGYSHDAYPAIAELLAYQRDAETGSPGFLREPQLRALELYWYLRLVRDTPHIFELYRTLYPRTSDLLDALGLGHGEIKELVLDDGLDALWERVRSDDEFVRAHKLESVRETLTLDYPSYILALAMGAGKTILIGAIIATEFAMAQEYPDGPFVQNALVFAPGKTILESLRELAEIPFARILPPRMHKPFAASVTLTFTRDGERDIPVIRGSLFNIVVTNTEKIRIQKETVRKSDLGSLFAPGQEDAAKEEVANLRLQTIASLPHLGVFSDEAHHTYGQSLLGKWIRDRTTGERVFREAGVKKVRKTVDYLAEQTNVVCVVNTTGTPYFERQPLRDVVIWYGLSEGIRDGILKPVSDNIFAYSYDGTESAALSREVVTTFFRDYGDVRLPNGAAAKLAIYFPQNKDLDELRPSVEAALAEIGVPPTVVLRNTSESSRDEIDAFNRLNDPRSPHRVILLVNKGTEGWNCPSLFACALLRKLRTSNNFVLQAATRCLRQVPGNHRPARIYLSQENRSVLDRQLQETYGETLRDIEHTPRERGTATLVLRKFRMPPLVVTRIIRTVVAADAQSAAPLRLERPESGWAALTRTTLEVHEQRHATQAVLQQVGDAVVIDTAARVLDLYAAVTELAGSHRLDLWELYDELARIYPDREVAEADLAGLACQIEEQRRAYEVVEEEVDVALALVRLDSHTGMPDPRGWNRVEDADGGSVYTAEITYFKDRERYLFPMDAATGNPGFGFHYTPYDFDSKPEMDFFERILREIDLAPDDIEDIYYTGALTDPNKTEFFIEYKDESGKWRRYTPDFVIRKTDGQCLIIEIKWSIARHHPIDGEAGRKAMQLRRWEQLNPDRLRYHMIFTDSDAVPVDQLRPAVEFVTSQGEAAL